MDRYFELIDKTPFSSDVEQLFHPSKERIRVQDYRLDLQLAKLKRCL
jgi:hypothetical protein